MRLAALTVLVLFFHLEVGRTKNRPTFRLPCRRSRAPLGPFTDPPASIVGYSFVFFSSRKSMRTLACYKALTTLRVSSEIGSVDAEG